jgi:hypothetical protein
VQFEKPVRVGLTPAQSTYTLISGPEDAARFLLDRWPAKSYTPSFLKAAEAVTRANHAIHDRMPAEKARKAFEGAAREADLLMPDAVKPEPIPEFKSPSWRKR